MHSLLFIHNIIINKNKYKYIFTNIVFVLLFSFIYWYYGTKEHLTFKKEFSYNENISYLSALYFTCTTHSCTGYGDITPKSRFMQSVVIIHLTLLFLNIIVLFI
jgi:hypothetical protein